MPTFLLMAKFFTGIGELIRRLNAENKLLSAVFENRKRIEFTLADAWAYVESEKNLQLLIDYGILHLEEGIIELDETYMRFFEDVLQINEEISQRTVEECVLQLQDIIDLYLKERNYPEKQVVYLRKARRTLRYIAQLAVRNVIDLKRNVNDTYRNEVNYEVKRLRLEKFKQQTIDIACLVRDTEQLLDSEDSTFKVLSPDEHFMHITIDARTQLKDAYHNLIDLQKTIRDFLHQVEAQQQLVKKVRMLKYLKDQLTWQHSTNVVQVLDQLNDLALSSIPTYTTKPSLTFLRNNDEGTILLNEARKTIHKSIQLRYAPPPKITPKMMRDKTIIEDFVDVDALARAFFASSNDLFSYIVKYAFNKPQSLEHRVELYAEIAQTYFERLEFTDQCSYYQGIQYPLIYQK